MLDLLHRLGQQSRLVGEFIAHSADRILVDRAFSLNLRDLLHHVLNLRVHHSLLSFKRRLLQNHLIDPLLCVLEIVLLLAHDAHRVVRLPVGELVEFSLRAVHQALPTVHLALDLGQCLRDQLIDMFVDLPELVIVDGTVHLELSRHLIEAMLELLNARCRSLVLLDDKLDFVRASDVLPQRLGHLGDQLVVLLYFANGALEQR